MIRTSSYPDAPPRYDAETTPPPMSSAPASPPLTAWHLEEPQAVSPAIHPLIGTEIVVGRSHTADLVLHHRDVSRVHLRLRRTGAAYQVTDLDSSFGTAINGREVESGRAYVLADGDLLRIGRRVFAVRRSSPLGSAAGEEQARHGGHLRLVPLNDDTDPARSIRLAGLGPWVAGRNPLDAALPLPYPSISRQHAVFVRRGHSYWVRDLSQVGTTAGGTSLRPGELIRLVDGDIVGFQDVRFRVEIEAS